MASKVLFRSPTGLITSLELYLNIGTRLFTLTKIEILFDFVFFWCIFQISCLIFFSKEQPFDHNWTDTTMYVPQRKFLKSEIFKIVYIAVNFFSLGVNILIDCHQWIHRCSFDWFKQKKNCLARITRLKPDLCVIKYSKYLQVINSRWFFRWASTSSEANGQTSARLFQFSVRCTIEHTLIKRKQWFVVLGNGIPNNVQSTKKKLMNRFEQGRSHPLPCKK